MPLDADSSSAMVDPRPSSDSPAYSNYESVPSDSFFTEVDYSGAFGEDLWLSGLSWLDANGKLPANEWGPELCGDITSDTTLTADNTYFLTCQTFVKSGATLTIEKGTTIKALKDDGLGKAPTLVVQQGAKIMADGTADAPITFTSALPSSQLPATGTWGGLIVLGRAPVIPKSGSNTRTVEGLDAADGMYGGTSAGDNSGILRYERIMCRKEGIYKT